MAIAFNKTKGKAQSSKVDSYTYTDGDNTVRLFGGVLPRYVYWLKGSNNKDIPVECLAFDREEERFNNRETDHVQKFFPEAKCSWSYVANCIDPKDGKAKVINLKKKLFEQILTAAEDIGDPTDLDTGWDVVFKRVKTGPLPFNVEYQLKALACKPRALTPAERELIAKDKTIDEKYPRPTPEDVLKTLERITQGGDEEADSTTDSEAVNELG
jgi:RNAse (barnase) inhibitor barstar